MAISWKNLQKTAHHQRTRAVRKHSISIRGHRTSFSLEEPFWLGLQKIARERDIPVARLVTTIDAKRREDENLSSAIRVFVLQQLAGRNPGRNH